jgi:hypothetical protein
MTTSLQSSGNTRTVFVVQVDNSKDLSDARRFGQLRAVFSRPRKPYNTRMMIAKARRVLSEWEPGDYLLMVGDPSLCAICAALVTEQDYKLNLLSWDRELFQYITHQWDFGQNAEDYDDFATADD